MKAKSLTSNKSPKMGYLSLRDEENDEIQVFHVVMTPLSLHRIHSRQKNHPSLQFHSHHSFAQHSPSSDPRPFKSPEPVVLRKRPYFISQTYEQHVTQKTHRETKHQQRYARRHQTLPSIHIETQNPNSESKTSINPPQSPTVNPENLTIIKKVLKQRREKQKKSNIFTNQLNMKEESQVFKRKISSCNPQDREISTEYTRKMALRKKLGFMFERRQRYPSYRQ